MLFSDYSIDELETSRPEKVIGVVSFHLKCSCAIVYRIQEAMESQVNGMRYCESC